VSRDNDTKRRRSETMSTGILAPRIVSNFRMPSFDAPFPPIKRRAMSNPRRIIIHHTAGWPCATAESIHVGHLKEFGDNRGIAYHFVVETGLNQYGDKVIGHAVVAQGLHLNLQGWHTGGLNAATSTDAIGIAVVGNFTSHTDSTSKHDMPREAPCRATERFDREQTMILNENQYQNLPVSNGASIPPNRYLTQQYPQSLNRDYC